MTETEKFNTRHGGPWDRGTADSYYRRGCTPHYFIGGTYNSPIVRVNEMTEEDIEAYIAGYDYNENFGEKKNYE